MHVRVSRLGLLSEHVPAFEPTHVVSLLDPSLPASRVPSFPGSCRVLQLRFYDDDDLDKQVEPIQVPAQAILDCFASVLARPEGVRLLLHCHAGASRSPAAAYVLLFMQLGDAELAFERLLQITVKPWPSRRLVEVCDALLGAGGRLVAPLERYHAAHPRRYDAYMRLNRRRGLE